MFAAAHLPRRVAGVSNMAPDDRWLAVPLIGVAVAVVLINRVGWAVGGGVILAWLVVALLYRSGVAPAAFR